MKIAAIIQARCGSTRLPNKTFANICEAPLIWHVVNRLSFASTLTEIVLATTTNPEDDKLCEWADVNHIKTFRGSENNVLNRYSKAAKFVNADVVVRVTADDPFKEPNLIDQAVRKLLDSRADFVSNNYPPSYPEGLDVEVFTKLALDKAEKEAISLFEKEHVTQYFYHHLSSFKFFNISHSSDLSHFRWTIDTEEDLMMVRRIYTLLYKDSKSIFYMEDILNLLKQYPEIPKINMDVARSEMYKSK